MDRLRRVPVVVVALLAMSMGFARFSGPRVGFASVSHTAILHSTMNGANEVGCMAGPPNCGSAVATGSTLITLNAPAGTVCYVIRVSGLTSPLTAGHIHIGDAGTAGPVVIPLPLTGGPNTFAGCTTANPVLVQAIIDNPGGYYTNVHNAAFPAGVIRGQLSPLAR